jgi:hypothetical protein
MKGERRKAVRAVRNGHEKVDEEDSEIAYSVAYQKLEVSAAIPYYHMRGWGIIQMITPTKLQKRKTI